ncbi:hypothetical protein [Allobranchiibius huperziae]|uniref:hypothetical protein n=1 Tax=Allobranchiibius huperziae TaxID=1874116 RepID=UPI001FED1DC3|nr:hypothetical protein [Allobranchiibius huperziae]
MLVFGDDFLAVFFVVFAAPAVARAAGVAASRDATLPAAGRAVLRAVPAVLAADPVRAAFFAGVFLAGGRATIAFSDAFFADALSLAFFTGAFFAVFAAPDFVATDFLVTGRFAVAGRADDGSEVSPAPVTTRAALRNTDVTLDARAAAAAITRAESAGCVLPIAPLRPLEAGNGLARLCLPQDRGSRGTC